MDKHHAYSRTPSASPPHPDNGWVTGQRTPESIEDYYARIESALGPERRLEVAVTEMPGWDIYPYEIDSLVLKPLKPLAEVEPLRKGEDPAECWCAKSYRVDNGLLIWGNERWSLRLALTTGLPFMATLGPHEHYDLASLPDDMAAELGLLTVAVTRAVEELDVVGRVHVCKYGDGGAHLHVFFFGRPARMTQFRGSPLLDWEENLPRVPLEVLQANAEPVARALLERLGGEIGQLGR